MKQYDAASLKQIHDLLKESFGAISDEYYVLKSQRNDLEVNLNILLSEENKSRAESTGEELLSPRKSDRKKDESIPGQIKLIRGKLDELNKRINDLNEKRNAYNDSIELFEDLITDMDDSDILMRPNAKKKNMKVVKKESPLMKIEENASYQLSAADLGKLDHIAHTFSNVSTYTKFDPNRASIELVQISKEMTTIISSAKKI